MTIKKPIDQISQADARHIFYTILGLTKTVIYLNTRKKVKREFDFDLAKKIIINWQQGKQPEPQSALVRKFLSKKYIL